jgi:hypothetical protein
VIVELVICDLQRLHPELGESFSGHLHCHQASIVRRFGLGA